MKIGDKVVCVDDGPCRCHGHKVPVKKGRVYVIESFPVPDKRNVTGVILIGVRQQRNHLRGVNIKRVRLLDEMKQEAADRQNLLKPLTVPSPGACAA